MLLAALMGVGVASSQVASSVQANEYNFVRPSARTRPLLAQNPSTYRDSATDSTNDFKNIAGIAGLAMGIGMFGWYLNRTHRSSTGHALSSESPSLLGHVSPKLRQQLLRLVHSQQTASRLLSGAAVRHAGRSPNWLAEKVIYDLQRDRI